MQLYSFFNLCARWCGWLTRRSRRLTRGKDLVPIAQEAGRAPGPIQMGAENLAAHWESISEPSSPQRVAVCARLPCIPEDLTFRIFTFSPHSFFYLFSMDLITNSDYFLDSINGLVFITEAECIYCGMRAVSLNVMQVNVLRGKSQRVTW